MATRVSGGRAPAGSAFANFPRGITVHKGLVQTLYANSTGVYVVRSGPGRLTAVHSANLTNGFAAAEVSAANRASMHGLTTLDSGKVFVANEATDVAYEFSVAASSPVGQETAITRITGESFAFGLTGNERIVSMAHWDESIYVLDATNTSIYGYDADGNAFASGTVDLVAANSTPAGLAINTVTGVAYVADENNSVYAYNLRTRQPVPTENWSLDDLGLFTVEDIALLDGDLQFQVLLRRSGRPARLNFYEGVTPDTTLTFPSRTADVTGSLGYEADIEGLAWHTGAVYMLDNTTMYRYTFDGSTFVEDQVFEGNVPVGLGVQGIAITRAGVIYIASSSGAAGLSAYEFNAAHTDIEASTARGIRPVNQGVGQTGPNYWAVDTAITATTIYALHPASSEYIHGYLLASGVGAGAFAVSTANTNLKGFAIHDGVAYVLDAPAGSSPTYKVFAYNILTQHRMHSEEWEIGDIPPGFIAEGLAFDPDTGSFIVGFEHAAGEQDSRVHAYTGPTPKTAGSTAPVYIGGNLHSFRVADKIHDLYIGGNKFG